MFLKTGLRVRKRRQFFGDGKMKTSEIGKKTMLAVVAVGLLLLLPPARVRADEIGDLKEQLKVQQQMMQQLQERLAQLEARQQIKEKSLTQKIEEVAQKAEQKPTALPDSLKWAEKVKISGDLRYRHEHVDEEKTGSVRWKDGVDRHRVRARLMLEALLNDEWGLGFRIATGSADPVSTNQNLESSFSKKDIWLDLAYFDYHPAAVKGLNVYGGKIKNPFYAVGKNQLIWDSDLNPEGIAATYSKALSDKDTLHLAGGGFWVDENIASTATDVSLWGAQAYIKHAIGNPDTLILGATYLDFGNIQGAANLPSTWVGGTSFLGNTASGGAYVNDYDILEVFGEYQTKAGGMPVSVFGNWVKNLSAATSEDTGWLVGATLNKCKDPGSWEIGYNYRDLEAEAVVGALNDSDFVGGGTDGKGHVFSAAYQVHKNVQAAMAYFLNQDTANSQDRELDYHRLQADLLFKF
jgi:hypothetical protein